MNLVLLAGQQGGMGTMIMFGAVFLVMYFFMIRPQQKRRKQLEADRASIQKGDKIITIGGVHGTVTKVDDDTVTIQLEEGKMVVDRTAITLDGGSPLPEEANR